MDEKQRAASEKPFSAPVISLPKGGGAIRGIGEKFAANPVTGTGSITVPIATSPGRSGFGPQLNLTYDSGSGNGPFGFGWSLSIPAITRKTDKGLPQYLDAEESDVFILSGAEDLVPVLVEVNGKWERQSVPPRMVGEDKYRIEHYRPRIEGLFARIERWTRERDGDVHWRSISRDNILTLYGKDNQSRIFDPADNRRIFSWLICETRDDKGNAILYEYKMEDGEGVDLTQAHERNRGNRSDAQRNTNRYLKRILYGNRLSVLDDEGKRQPFLTADQVVRAGWMFEVVFDYQEGHYEKIPLDPDRPETEQHQYARASTFGSRSWAVRADPFSSYRAGFEVRMYRLCQRVLMFHHFPDEDDVRNDCLVRSTDFTYSHELDPASARNPIYTFLRAVTQSGYRRANAGYLKRSLPPVEFEYSQPTVQDRVEEVDSASLENLSIGVDGTTFQWTDLHGEGIPGILTEQANAWFYKRNLSPICEETVQFAPLEQVDVKPNLALTAGAQFMDLAGDGQPDLVAFEGPLPGLYEHDGKEGWQPFRPFLSALNRDIRDPNLKFVDLNGDGHADVLITEEDAFVWHASLAEAGFGPAQTVHQVLDEERGPRLVFADGTQSIYLADLSGDGLTDLVRVRNGEVCYWPNLGYGRFGAKVTMDHAPRFDQPDQFDQKRIRLGDIDGSGTTDILYLHRDGVRLYFNQSGNSWSEPQILCVFPRVDDLVNIVPTDLLGNGTACLVWSSALPGDAARPMRYVNLMGGQKPHLLVKTANNLGAETRVCYAPSTKFYLQDRRDGKPWITRLPFPVHVVERVETYDHIGRNRFVTQYAYHHGYFDGEEREFRGFGMVEQQDTEEIAALRASGSQPEASNSDIASHVPPVLTRTWFHTGMYLGREHVSDFFAGIGKGEGEYYREPALRGDDAYDAAAKTLLLPDAMLPADLSIEDEREACRALKGSMLRQEVYALDGTEKAEHPYTVTEQNFTIRRLQPSDGHRHAVFFTHSNEALAYHYEREPANPRIQHSLTLEVDTYGNALKQVVVGYGRRESLLDQEWDRRQQTTTLVIYTENDLTEAINYPDDYRTPLPAETRTYELTGYEPTGAAGRYRYEDFVRQDPGDPTRWTHIYEAETDYEDAPEPGRQRRLIERIRILYRPDDLGASQNDPHRLLAPRTMGALALPGESYKLAFTPGLVAKVFQRNGEALLPDPAGLLGGKGADAGGYVDLDGDGHWWIPSGRVFYSPDSTDGAGDELARARQHFFLPHRYRDPFHTDAVGTETIVAYDNYDLLVVQTTDTLDNTIQARSDYRALQPDLITDPNGNRSEVVYDALGLVAGTAVMGKENEPDGRPKGDSMDGFQPDLTQAQVDTFMEHPRDPGPTESESSAAEIVHVLLGKATARIVYDLDCYRSLGQPSFAATIARETHVNDLQADGRSKLQVTFGYSDGFGREIQKKIQAEPGPVPKRDAEETIIVGQDGQPEITDHDVSPRWVGSGWTVFNNKGKPVRQYEPFFTDSHRFESDVRIGVSPVLFYDPVGRVVATLHPNHTYEKVVFDPWQQITWDVNDTILGDPRTDPDLAGYVRRYFETQPEDWQTWYLQRRDGALGAQEQAAARKSAVHAETKGITHFDTLGRPFLTIALNKYERRKPDNTTEVVDEPPYHTRVELDIEGNQRAVRDAVVQNGDLLGRVVMCYDYDMLGSHIHQASMEAGEQWMLNDVTGKPIRAWDSRGFLRHMTYDQLRRPRQLLVTENDTDHLAEETVYGEDQGSAHNHRTHVYQVKDSAGIVTSERYDFKGNLLVSKREILADYQHAVNWKQASAAWDGTFTSGTEYDALNRPTGVTTHDGSIYRPTFNEANLLNAVEVNLRGAETATPFVNNIDYNAKGQRTLIQYANDVRTEYEYDAQAFRLTHLQTTRPAGRNGLTSSLFANEAVIQDLYYTYDPAGNITRIEDRSLKMIHHKNQPVEPICTYTYDAIYRLIEAHGREHIGQATFDFEPPDGNRRDYPFAGLHSNVNDPEAVRIYGESYEYDEVGNFQRMRHAADNGSWTRQYFYEENSLIEGEGKKSNRLTRTQIGNGTNFPETYTYKDALVNDVHGCMTGINTMQLSWDFEDQLHEIHLAGNETAYYVYDAAGQRVRKVIERQNGTKKKERIYLGGFEIYREYNGAEGTTLKLERETLHVMDAKQRIAIVETQTINGGKRIDEPAPVPRYQLGNHLGSASAELAEDGSLISYEEYHPYGTTAFQAGQSGAEVSVKRYRYTGKERDEESGLYYHGARFFAPWLGRWTSADPAGISDGTNLYTYVSSNPLSAVDPDGKQEQLLDPSSELEYWFQYRGLYYRLLRGCGEQCVKRTFGSRGAALLDKYEKQLEKRLQAPLQRVREVTKGPSDLELAYRIRQDSRTTPQVVLTEKERKLTTYWDYVALASEQARSYEGWADKAIELYRTTPQPPEIPSRVYTREELYREYTLAEKQGQTIIYLRTKPGGMEPYVGRADAGLLDAGFGRRQAEHADRNRTVYEFRILERVWAEQGKVAEQAWMLRLFGPSRVGGPLANRRWEMNYESYIRESRRLGREPVSRPEIYGPTARPIPRPTRPLVPGPRINLAPRGK